MSTADRQLLLSVLEDDGACLFEAAEIEGRRTLYCILDCCVLCCNVVVLYCTLLFLYFIVLYCILLDYNILYDLFHLF